MHPSPFTARWASVTIATTAAVDSVAEPDAHPAARPFKEALVADGIPVNSSVVDDVNAEFERLRGAQASGSGKSRSRWAGSRRLFD